MAATAMTTLAARAPYAAWLPFGVGATRPAVRLFCFSHAGGGASAFRSWLGAAGSEIAICPVQLPGRETRFGDRPIDDMEELVDRLVEILLPFMDSPFALLGHSMGGFVAYELAAAVEARAGLVARSLVASSATAPHLGVRARERISELPDAELVQALDARYEGIPREIRDQPEHLAVFLPLLRGDLRLLENYAPPRRASLGCPIHGFRGTEDRGVSPEELAGWADYTRAGFTATELAGGHFAAFAHPGLAERLSGLLAAHAADVLSSQPGSDGHD
jgi:surfactin synthase thioesterase subunit